MITVNKYYYASTPRLQKLHRQERVQILEIGESSVKCKTADPLRYEEVYILPVENIRVSL